MEEEKRGTDWSEEENDRTVQAYFEYLLAERKGAILRPKTHIYKDVGAEIGRTYKAVERKFQNISAVLERVGEDWIPGLAPLHNYQKGLADAIERYLPELQQAAQSHNYPSVEENPQAPYAFAPPSLNFEDAPQTALKESAQPEFIERLVRKFDPSLRDLRNRALGKQGEQYVFENEVSRLNALGRQDLARKVDWVADTKGDGAGYDVRSYTPEGEETFIEVKTTNGPKTTPFFMSSNELEFSKEAASHYSLIRLFTFRRDPRAYRLTHPLNRSVIITPDHYRLSF